MKRITSVIILAAAVLCLISAAGTPGSSSDPLVTKSYVDDVFVPKLISEAEQAASKTLGAEAERAERRADGVRDSALMRLGVDGYTLTESFISVKLDSGDTVSMLTGGKLIPTSGTVFVTVKGTLINITNGTEVPSGSQLTLYNRYFCAEDTTVTYTARSASTCLIDGYYSTTGGSGEPGPSTRFSDVSDPNTWFYDAVYYCADMGLVEGMGGGIFSPATTMNMAQLTQLLYRMAGNEDAEGEYWWSAAEKWAIEAGILTADEFKPAENVTREFFFRMFYACAAQTGKFDMTPRADITGAVDYADIDEANRDAISWAVAAGMVKGTSATSLKIDPDDEVNRAMACVLIMRYFESV